MPDRYRQAFSNLRTDAGRTRWPARTRHRAPHKPLLLLSVLDLFAQGAIADPSYHCACICPTVLAML
jgi:hypothetical protein